MTKFLLLLFLTCNCIIAGIIFQKESIVAVITACNTLEIQGTYYFLNNDTSTMSTVIYYPFPVDSSLLYPHYISVVRLSNHEKISYIQKQEGISWYQITPPGSTDSIQVTYRQKTRKTNGRYILTTTQDWQRPLEQAAFTVITPDNITLSYWSFQYDSVSMRNGRMYYYSFQKNFFPNSDMLLKWNCEE
jgi:hypothetical protein